MDPTVFDRRDELGDRPGTHALIVGVSHYEHLPDYGQPREADGVRIDPSLGLTRQTIAASSAHALYRWLVDHKDRLEAPLATCRLLIAPSRDEIARQPELEPLGSACGIEPFVRQANEWRADAAKHRGSQALFYFAGNGFELEKSDPVVALGDLGDGVGPLLKSTVRVDDLFRGMAPAPWQPEMARTQIYLIDTDLDPIQPLPPPLRLGTTPPFDIGRGLMDERGAVIFYASATGPALGFKGGQTFFLVALLKCLDGLAAIPAGVDEVGAPRWQVTINSLAQALGPLVREMAARVNREQEVSVSGLVREAVLYRIEGVPRARVRVEIDPPEALAAAKVEIFDAQDKPVALAPHKKDPGVLAGPLPAGYYRLRVSFDPARPDYADVQSIQLLMPPKAVWKVRVTR